jgi:hypothetical protein
MSEPGIGVTASANERLSGDGSQAPFPIHRSWKIAIVVAVVMVLLALSLALLILTKADQYLWLIFVVGFVSVVAMIVLMRSLTVTQAKRLAANKAA